MNSQNFLPQAIKGYEDNYTIDILGNVLSKESKLWNGKNWRIKPAKYLKPTKGKIGYLVIGLSKNKKCKLHYIHRLIAEAFIPNPQKKPQINHKDGNKLNNKLENLEWVTCKENINHAISTGLTIAKPRYGEKNPAHKVTLYQVKKIRKEKGMLKNIAPKYGISISQTWAIINNKSWTNI